MVGKTRDEALGWPAGAGARQQAGKARQADFRTFGLGSLAHAASPTASPVVI